MTDLFATITSADADRELQRPRRNIPELFREPPAHITHPRARICNLNILALDLGTTCGWAYAARDGRQRSGSFELKPSKLGGNGKRWLAFRELLTATGREIGGLQAVYFEDVKNHAGTLAAHIYGGYLAMLEAWCAANNIPLYGVGVGTIKKHWTGHGRADKDAMVIEARRRGFTPGCDNEADALAILSYAVKQEQ